MEPHKVIRIVTDFIAKETQKRNSEGVIVGLSGGLDSSVAATLAVQALGPRYVFALILPDSNITPKSDIYDAQHIAKCLRVKYRTIEIGAMKKSLIGKLPRNKLAQGNFASRLRMGILYYYAAVMHRLVLGTTDKSELRLGYYTKHGDGAADIFPIADLYKTDVRELARHLQIPSMILEKKSSPRLWRAQTAEGEIGLSYEEIDHILRRLDANISYNSKLNPKYLQRIQDLVKNNKHKQEMPPICKVNDC
ncbi:MAG: NAD+ synthase [Nitrososphaeraceae archaeon]